MTRTSRHDDLETIAAGVWRLSRVFDRVRTQMISDTEVLSDHTSVVLLFALVNRGPMRASALADEVHSDASTISRQVAALVARGFIERQADQRDGRATLLVATPAACDLVAAKGRTRDEHFSRVLGDWSDTQVRDLAPLLSRLTLDLERHLHAVMAEGSCPAAPTTTPTRRTR